jgi:hypothetical protein
MSAKLYLIELWLFDLDQAEALRSSWVLDQTSSANQPISLNGAQTLVDHSGQVQEWNKWRARWRKPASEVPTGRAVLFPAAHQSDR